MEFKAINPAKHALSLVEEFKEFAFKGSVVDLAVGVIIGGAFTNIVNSLVHNVLMPLIGVVLPSEHGYDRWALVLRGKAIPYGRFIGDIVNFLVMALALYLFIVKFLGWIMRFRAQQAAIPPLTKDQVLLTEIRDLLKEESKPSV
jgi:large conductance mechanosensitive channel